MADVRHPNQINFAVSPEQKTEIQDTAWKLRTNQRELCRRLISFGLAVTNGIEGNPRARELYSQLLAELDLVPEAAAV